MSIREQRVERIVQGRSFSFPHRWAISWALTCALLPAVEIDAQHPCDVAADDFVKVIVDMDASTPGCQSDVVVPPGTTIVEDVAVYILDRQQRPIWGIGYFGGLDRGIAFGHMPAGGCVRGSVQDLAGVPVTPVNPGGSGLLDHAPGFEPSFAGPEVQYLEGAGASPAPISANPAGPVFTVDIMLDQAAAGDVFEFHLSDQVVIWTGGMNGAFSTQGTLTLDTGGDAILDGTVTLHGVDVDGSIPVPPASFRVDFVDGPATGGPATITVYARRGDHNLDGVVDPADVSGFVNVLLGASSDPNQAAIADHNCDDRADGADLPGFVELVLAGG